MASRQRLLGAIMLKWIYNFFFTDDCGNDIEDKDITCEKSFLKHNEKDKRWKI